VKNNTVEMLLVWLMGKMEKTLSFLAWNLTMLIVKCTTRCTAWFWWDFFCVFCM